MLNELMNYMTQNRSQIFKLLLEHIELTLFSVVIAICVGVPIGILISYFKPATKPVMGFANLVQAIPSMALLGFAIPLLGIGTKPAICMVVLYSLLPIIKNTYTGLQNVGKDVIEAARGIGMTSSQILFKIQLPLALPVIMAGVRISAVSAVGLMTLAAFVGAGGLGYLVYAGIRTVNTVQILAGAIPSCVLALLIDYIVSIIERMVTPRSLQNTKKLSKRKEIFQKIVLIVTAAALLTAFIANHHGGGKETKTITIGSMDFTEQETLSYLVKYLLEENTDMKVEQKLSLGSSGIVMDAMKTNDIDMYIDYTGTLYGNVLGYEPNSDADEVYETVKKDLKEQYNMYVLDSLNFNNTYTLTMEKGKAKQYGIETISDLADVAGSLTLGPTLTFIERKDCMQALEEVYDMEFGNTIPIDGSPRYTALMNNETDVTDAYSTDGLLKKFDLKVLEDDKHAFLPYHAIPVVNPDIKENYPEVAKQLKKLGEVLSEEVMVELNYQVDVKKMQPEEAAQTFLEEKKLIK